MPENTGPQTVTSIAFGGDKTDGGLAWYKKARLLRKDPTIALARALAIAPVLAATWSTETNGNTAADEHQDFIDEQMQPVRLHLVKTALSGMIDFGWQGFEKVFEINGRGEFIVKKFKPLLHDITEIVVEAKDGSFNGFENAAPDQDPVIVDLENALLFSNNVEGTDWYGNGILQNAAKPYDDWLVSNSAATRYDKKIAGSHWVVHYPLGVSDYNGVPDTPNDEIAQKILQSLESSGAIAVPRKVEALTEDLNDQAPDAWKIELLSDSGSTAASFVDRMKYLDALKVRAFEMPERAILEGQFGTKAEAEAHANFAITNIELRHQFIAQTINWHIVNQLLISNYGPEFENTVRIVPTPLSDPITGFLKEVYRTILNSPDGFLEESDAIDTDALKTKLGIPVNSALAENITQVVQEGVEDV